MIMYNIYKPTRVVIKEKCIVQKNKYLGCNQGLRKTTISWGIVFIRKCNQITYG